MPNRVSISNCLVNVEIETTKLEVEKNWMKGRCSSVSVTSKTPLMHNLRLVVAIKLRVGKERVGN